MGRQVDSGAPSRGEAEQVPGRHLALGPGEQQPGGRPPPEGQAGDGLRGALHGQRAPQPALRVPERDKVAEGEAVDRSVIEMLLSLGGLSEVRIMHTEGYQDIIVLRWSLRSESYAH